MPKNDFVYFTFHVSSRAEAVTVVTPGFGSLRGRRLVPPDDLGCLPLPICALMQVSDEMILGHTSLICLV